MHVEEKGWDYGGSDQYYRGGRGSSGTLYIMNELLAVERQYMEVGDSQ